MSGMLDQSACIVTAPVFLSADIYTLSAQAGTVVSENAVHGVIISPHVGEKIAAASLEPAYQDFRKA